MDTCDLASAYAERFQKEALARQLEGRQGTPGDSFLECVDCGEEIPKGRREASLGCVRCVQCESMHERKRA